MKVARDVFDDHGTETSYMSGVALHFLSAALFPSSPTKARFYGNLSVNLLHDSKTRSRQQDLTKKLIIRVQNFEGHSITIREVMDELEEFQRQGRLLIDDDIPVPQENPFDQMYGVRGSSAKLGSNVIFQMIRKRAPEFFRMEDATISTAFAARIFITEGSAFVKCLLLTFMPHFCDSVIGFREAHLHVPPDALPDLLAQKLIEFLEFFDVAWERFPATDEKPKALKSDNLRMYIHRSTGNVKLAVEAANRSLDATVRVMDQKFFHHCYTLFLCGSCYVQFRDFESLEHVLNLLRDCVGAFHSASQAIDVLVAGRDAVLSPACSFR